MKSSLLLLILMAALAAKAQPTNTPATNVAQVLEAMRASSAQKSVDLKQAAPNEIFSGKITYSGIAVEAAKTARPLQLLNPLAPPQYGSPEDNVVRDPINGRVTGLKLFAIRF